MKFEIIIDGQRAELNAGMSIMLERHNPMLDFETVRGGSVLDFVLPFCPKNNAIFKNFGHAQVAYKFQEYKCEKLVDGRVIERGFIQLNGVGPSGFSVFFTQNLGEIFGDYQTEPLNKLPLGSEAIPAFVGTTDITVAKYCLPKIQNSIFYGNEGGTISYTGFVNDYSGGYTAGPKVPMLSVHWVLKKIGELCDFKFKGEFMNDSRMKRLIFYNTFSLDGATTIDYANHLPEITLPDLLKELRRLFNLALFFDVWKRECTIDYVDTLLTKPVILNWSRKFPTLKNKRPELHNRLELNWDLDTDDALMKEVPAEFEKYTTAAAANTELLFPIKTRFSSLKMNGLIPHAEQIGISDQFGQKSNKFAPRLLFWHGLVGGVPAAKNSYADVELNWNGANGLKNRFFSAYEKFRSKTYAVLTAANLNANELAEIDMHQKAGQTVSVHVQGLNYIIGDQKILLPNYQNQVLELWKK